jgi:hypothetical protein
MRLLELYLATEGAKGDNSKIIEIEPSILRC